MSKKNRFGITGLILILGYTSIFFSACSYKQDQVLFQGNAGTRDTMSKGVNPPAYKIQPQDILQIRNLQNIKYIVDDVASGNGTGGGAQSHAADLAEGQGYKVNETGTVALPVLGRVEVVGLTRLEAENKIEGLYRKTIIKDPIIEVKLTNIKVTVMGEVRSPGNYPLINDRTTLVEILGQAGGITDKADEKQIKVVRGGSVNPQTFIVDLGKASSLTDPVSILQNHDVIYVSQNKRAIRNDKFQTFTTLIQPALLVLNTALIIFTLSKR